MLSFDVSLECKFCDSHKPTTSSALRNHLSRHHQREDRANIAADSKQYYQRYVLPSTDMRYCAVCRLYLLQDPTLPSHPASYYHRYCLQNPPSSSASVPQSPQGARPSMDYQDETSGLDAGDCGPDYTGGDDEEGGADGESRDRVGKHGGVYGGGGEEGGCRGVQHGEGEAAGATRARAGGVETAAGPHVAASDGDATQEQSSSFAVDWLGRDSLGFGRHPMIGEVVLLPLNTPGWETHAGLREGSNDFKSYARYRVVDIKGDPMVARLYDIDVCPSRPPPLEQPRKRKANQVLPESLEYELPLELVELYGIKLGHRDVLRNIGGTGACEECGIETALRRCDGAFPICVSHHFPLDGWGRQHDCHRGAICGRCIEKEPRQRAKPWSLRHKGVVVSDVSYRNLLKRAGVFDRAIFWLCSRCTATTTDHLDAWGQGIVDAPFLLAPDSVHPTAPPVPNVAGTAAVQPADRAAAQRQGRAERLAAAVAQYGRYGGEAAVRAATTFARAVRRWWMPRSQQQVVLDVIHELRADGVFDGASASGVPFTIPLPKKIETLDERARNGMVTPADLRYRSVKLSLHQLDMQQQSTDIHIADLQDSIQSILLDPRLDPRVRFLFPVGTERAKFDERGEVVIGPEVWDGTMWTDLEGTLLPGARLLFLILHADKTVSLRGSRYPFRVQLANYSLEERRKDAGSRVVAFGPQMNIQRQRGSSMHGPLNEPQLAGKRTVNAAAPAHVLADLNELASEISSFELYCLDGTRRVRVQIRLGIVSADYEAKKELLGMGGANACPRCFSLVFAVEAERREGKVSTREYMRLDPQSRCETAEPRTVARVIGIQTELATMGRTASTKKALEEYAEKTGVAVDVECFLHRLFSLMPHSAGMPYAAFAPDQLHSFAMGWARKLPIMISRVMELLKRRGLGATQNFRTTADVHSRVDARLAHAPPYCDVPTFDVGWWESANTSATTASESVALAEQFAFAYVGDALLVPEPAMRRRLLALHWGVVSIGRELRTPQYYLNSELDDLDARLQHCCREFHWLHDLLQELSGSDDSTGVGDGMNIPKFHDLMCSAAMIRRFGSLMNADTGVFERQLKDAKRQDERVGRSRGNDGGEEVFTLLAACEMDRAVLAMEGAAAPVSANAASSSFSCTTTTGAAAGAEGYAHFGAAGSGTRLAVGLGRPWAMFLADIERGLHGPAVLPALFNGIAPALQSALGGTNYTHAPQYQVAETDLYDGTTERRVLKPGHCVELNDGEFAQVILVDVTADSLPGTAEAAPASPARILVLSFAMANPVSPLHPELPVPWLRRGALRLISAAQLRRRAHVIPLFKGGENDSPCEPFPAEFLVNTLAHPLHAGRPGRKIYLGCPHCKEGRLLKPRRIGDSVTCPQCGTTSPWF